jgi:hypothetical protein
LIDFSPDWAPDFSPSMNPAALGQQVPVVDEVYREAD